MFEGWDEFYLLIGSAGGALIGLLFVVVTLTTGAADRSSTQRSQSLFMTPNVFHFAVVLVISGMAMTPGLSNLAEALIAGAAALAGAAVAGRVTLVLFTNKTVAPDWTDPWYYGVGPLVLYLGLLGASFAIAVGCKDATYAVAAVVSALLLLTIRNAWDLVTWLAPRADKP